MTTMHVINILRILVPCPESSSSSFSCGVKDKLPLLDTHGSTEQFLIRLSKFRGDPNGWVTLQRVRDSARNYTRPFSLFPYWMLSTYTTQPPPGLPSPLPLRKDSLSNSIQKQSNHPTPLVQCREDAKYARIALAASIANDEDIAGMQLDDDEHARRYDDRTRGLTEMLDRMTTWVEELVSSCSILAHMKE